MKERKVNCDIMMIKRVFNKNNMFIMESFDMDLLQWIMKNADDKYHIIKHSEKIINEIKEQLYCLLDVDKDYLYTDLKPANILVNVDYKMDITKISLGDLDSVIKKNGKYIGTYPFISNHELGIMKDKDLNENKEKENCINIY